METVEKETISLEEFRKTPVQAPLMEELRKLYPGAYDLKNTVKNPIPVFHEKEDGVIYVIKADDLEWRASCYIYVLWDGSVFHEIYKDEYPLRYIGNNMFVSVDEKNLWKTVTITCENIFPIKKKGSYRSASHYFSKDTQAFHHLTDLRVTNAGIYISGTDRKSESAKIGFFPFGGYHELHIIQFPEWADVSTWQPAYDGEEIFFSDEFTIYTLSFSEKKDNVKVIVHPKDVDVRLGKKHRWMQLPKVGTQLDVFGPVHKFIFIQDNYQHYNYLSDGREVSGIMMSTYRKHWIPFNDGFICAEEHGNNPITLRYYFWIDGSWQNVTILRDKKYKDDFQKIMLLEKDEESFYFGFKEEWYLINQKMIKAAVSK
ncbi:MAG TPA: hypothetical protein VL576_03265 [Candidatus Paceibacterota bacterium]|jgi:hypothetical protein|nr:hypothetical protein [Candidatus Paceibacterota bacterium]